MKLTGIDIYNFRSIGGKPVNLHPIKKCNIISGQNNSGKSNVLKAISKISSAFNNNNFSLDEVDFHKRSANNIFRFQLYFEPNLVDDERIKMFGGEHFVFDLQMESNRPPTIIDHSFAHIEDFEASGELLNFFNGEHWIRRVGPREINKKFLEISPQIFNHFKSCIPKVHIIPEFRQIKSGNNYELDGENLINLLSSYQHHLIGRDEDQKKFRDIELFIGKLLRLPNMTLEVTHENNIILIKHKNLRLPLSSYGTGVHELVILF